MRLAGLFGRMKDLDARFARGSSTADDGVAGREVPGHRRRRGGHQAAIHAAQLDRLARLGSIGAGEQHGLGGGQLGCGAFAGKLEEILDAGVERAGQAQRDGGVGDVGAGFHGIDGLPADPRHFGQLRRWKAAALAQTGQAILDAGGLRGFS